MRLTTSRSIEAEAEFRKRPPTLTSDALAELAGTYETASGVKWQVLVKDGKRLYLCFPGIPDFELVPYKKGSFRIPQFPDRVYEFGENPEHRVLRIAGPEGVYVLNWIRNLRLRANAPQAGCLLFARLFAHTFRSQLDPLLPVKDPNSTPENGRSRKHPDPSHGNSGYCG